ncbi:hypothetical protein [Bacillus horti]|uniref:Uncharacterized protein n=1 Tax=Caldalkalibacillus horti TaxID=77523 RepID=A0ABT9W545_9BACI|nr:hypothetical protein [Bacillus horti]MDQ0168184.1 hypothetical protein [Bacillus horti]
MLYLQPQFRTNSGEIFNVISSKEKILGYLLYIYKENDHLYVLGHLDDIGERQNYVDVLKHFVEGLKKICGAKEEPFVKIYCGGEQIDLSKEEGKS